MKLQCVNVLPSNYSSSYYYYFRPYYYYYYITLYYLTRKCGNMSNMNKYCHLRLPDVMPLLTSMFLGPQDTSDLMSMVSFTFTMQHHFIWLASAPFTFSHLAKFGLVLFGVCNAW